MSRWHGATLASFGPLGSPALTSNKSAIDLERPRMSHPALIRTPADQVAFVTAGKATFTIVSARTGERFTYRAEKRDGRDGGEVIFVSVLTGSDNEEDYTFLGTLFPSVAVRFGGHESPSWTFRHGRRSRIGEDAPSARGFAWVWRALTGPQQVTRHAASAYEFWHEGRCCRCGRLLSDPASIERGIGPDCLERSGS